MNETTDLVERLRELPRDTRKATMEIYDLCVEASYKIEELVDRCARYAEEIAVLRERLPEDSVKECIIFVPRYQSASFVWGDTLVLAVGCLTDGILRPKLSPTGCRCRKHCEQFLSWLMICKEEK